MAKPMVPVHVWACPYDWKEVTGEARPERCAEHDCPFIDMGWRVGNGTHDHSWYATLERALTDRRCK
jgi:hypothetical protein